LSSESAAIKTGRCLAGRLRSGEHGSPRSSISSDGYALYLLRARVGWEIPVLSQVRVVLRTLAGVAGACGRVNRSCCRSRGYFVAGPQGIRTTSSCWRLNRKNTQRHLDNLRCYITVGPIDLTALPGIRSTMRRPAFAQKHPPSLGGYGGRATFPFGHTEVTTSSSLSQRSVIVVCLARRGWVAGQL